MLSVGFWNVLKGIAGYAPLVSFACDVAADAALSGLVGETLLCFTEVGPLNEAGLLAALSAADPQRPWWTRRSTSGKFILVGTIPIAAWQNLPEGGGAWPNLITRPVNGLNETFLVWFVHLASPLGSSDLSRHTTQTARNLRYTVEAAELQLAAQSVLIGDFNMRPYDAGMVDPTALNAAPCLLEASRTRVIAGTRNPHFYNPCWELLGNRDSSRQPGTFRRNDRTDCVRWWLIDQLLIRPAIASRLTARTPRILTKVGEISLVTARGAAKKNISDHLPIVASLSI